MKTNLWMIYYPVRVQPVFVRVFVTLPNFYRFDERTLAAEPSEIIVSNVHIDKFINTKFAITSIIDKQWRIAHHAGIWQRAGGAQRRGGG